MSGTAAGHEAVLRVHGLHKSFGRRQVLRGVELELRRGEITALVGENGAGKSTVVRCVAGTVGIDSGWVEVDGRPVASGDVEVVWQDLALCDNLDVVANLFLGDEKVDRSGLVDEAGMVEEARALFARFHIPPADLQRPVGGMSGGERQLVAIARALRRVPSVLVLDEPTAALGVQEAAMVERLLAEVRGGGATAILLVSHRLEQVFGLADRIAVLREGRILAEVSSLEVHPDDVLALMTGIETDSAARRQLRRLRSLVEQLADVAPAASLPLIVSAMAEALAVDRLCIHLLDEGDGATGPRLRRSAALGIPASLLAALESLPVGTAGGPPGMAAATGQAVVVDDARTDPLWAPFLGSGRAQPGGFWSVPIVGAGGVLGTISGYADTVGRPQADQLELVWLYAGHAAAAVERERLLAEATRRNRVLETLRGVLDTLAGPLPANGGLGLALLALGRGLRCDAIALHRADGERSELFPDDLDPVAAELARARQRVVADGVHDETGGEPGVRRVDDVLAVPLDTPGGRAVVTAWWLDGDAPSADAFDLLGDAARSLRLALEREALEGAHAEAASLRRSERLQRDFLSRMNHELRTPLTAIQGYTSTLRQPDVEWDGPSQRRFLAAIASESARMDRLVGDLLDFSAIDSGTLRLTPDWCDVGLVLAAARQCMTAAPASLVVLHGIDGLPPVWADHDRLEQVFVNLLDNAVRHAAGLTRISVEAALGPDGRSVTIRVADDGVGIPADHGERMFLPHERGVTAAPGAGLGLAIARGIVEAHGGTIGLDPAAATGTVVSVVIPVEPADLHDAAKPAAAGSR